MPKYYFDHYDKGGVVIDDERIDLLNIDAARRLAIESLGQSIMDGAPQSVSGRTAIEVRDQTGAILRASAAIIWEELRSDPQVTGA
ncbi:DUF6894 family protein [Bradyrhizobium cosmicum]|uniref:DUF6894 domain-containing protein n=1 Tax=Bradyrhizobium cosmicum TaxID=1404864 RepID=A0AAI8MIJ5_9BRAD|nr:hypothetical protein S23_56330 [Bradyrhizobium cosmicum]